MLASNSYRARAARWVLTLAMLLSWTGAAPFIVHAAGGAEEAPLPPRARQALDMIARLCDLADAKLARPGADPADPAAASALLGGDVNKIFTFVRDTIAYEPYRGVLRGAGGTLASGAGNAIDRAALLAAMLKAGGHETRLVKAALPPDKAAALVQQFLSRDPLKGVLGQFVDGNLDANAVKTFAAEAGFDLTQIQPLIEKQNKDAQIFAQQTADTTASHYAYLKELIQQNKITIGRPADAWQKELTDRAAQHAWVQVKQGDQWVDLDPSLPGAKPGDKQLDGQPGAIEPAERHQVQFKLVYRFAGAEAKEEALITETIFADEAWAYPAQFRIVPSDPVPQMDQVIDSPEKSLEMLKKIKKFQPVLRMGKKTFAGRVFDTDGNLYDVSADGRVQGAAGLGSAAGGMFGGALGGGADEKPAGKFGELTVVLTSAAPGAKPRVQERVLLTAKDVTGQHVTLPILGWDMLVQSQWISSQWSEHGSLSHNLAVWRPALQALGDQQISPADFNKIASLDPSPYPEFLISFAALRQVAIAQQLKQTPGVVALIDSPQIIVSEQRFCLHVSNGGMCNKARIDIVDNAISFVPIAADKSSAAAEAAMRQGVYDTVTEAALLQQISTAPVGGALTAAERGRILGAGALVVAPAAVDELPAKAMPDPERKWIKQFELPSRKILVVDNSKDADSPALPAWWTLDAETGTILGRSVGGRGAALTENAVITINYGICLIAVLYDLGRNVQKNKKAGGPALSGRGAAKTIGTAIGCFVGFVAAYQRVGLGMQVVQNAFSLAIAIFGTEMDVGG